LFFEVYPNPATSYIQINVDRSHPEAIITIYNNQNQYVLNEKVKNIDKIDITALHPGVYFVKYELNEKSVVRKILKIQ
jgi:hypothetical protein